jgi:predicted nucleic acid-binding protein
VSLVLDSSMTLAWCFEDERTDESIAVLRQVAETGATVPSLWRLEVANGLQVAVRRKRIDAAYRDASVNDLRSLAISTDTETDHQAWSATLHLADRFGLTIYDAAYLELAHRLALPLATLDGELARAAISGSVALVGR